MPRLVLLLLGWLSCFGAFAQIPAGYYDAAAGLSGTPLRSALHDIIDGHSSLAYSALYSSFTHTDIRPDTTVWDMYSDIPGGVPPYVYHYISADECGNYTAEGDCFNREHAWPKSWFGGDVMPMYTDLFHLYPTDGWVNNKRGNFPYGDVGLATWTSMNGSKLGSCSWPGYSGTVFEPIDEYKGDFARSFFYMSVRYFGEDAGWPGSEMTTGATLKPWALAMLMQWSLEDTVSEKEIDRNNAIYQIQGNRNPFIDRPQFIQDIWGQGAGLQDSERTGFIAFPNPCHGKCRLIGGYRESSQEKTDVFLYSPDGRLSREFHETSNTASDLDVNGLPPGIYLVQIAHGNKLSFPIIKIAIY